MRVWLMLGAVAALTLSGAPSDARRHYSYHHSHSYGGSSEYYTAVSGHRVHRPIDARSVPRGASAQCGDGSWSFSESRRGTCSHHGGVSHWR